MAQLHIFLDYLIFIMQAILRFRIKPLILSIIADSHKFLLATSDYGQSIQENINSAVTDGDYNKVALRHVLDKKD